jgi:hypothetical protein
MELQFFTVTTWGRICVSELAAELQPLKNLAENWLFPYDIVCVIRVGRTNVKALRRFDKAANVLSMDFREDDGEYISISKNEQRERLGNLILSYLTESIKKYPKHANKAEQKELVAKIGQWMLENNWMYGKIEKARALLQEGRGTFDVSQFLDMPLEEVEDVLLRLYDAGKRTETHADNIHAGKAMPPI